MKRLNRAFTLTELLIALGVIALLCAVIMPIVFNLMPNQKTIMAKKAFYGIQTIAEEMINDPLCYPDRSTAKEDPAVGFDDGHGYIDCDIWQDTETPNADLKFRKIFYGLLGMSRDELDSVSTLGGFAEKEGFKGMNGFYRTDDDLYWGFTEDSKFENENSVYTLVIDVNGAAKPNCAQGVTAVKPLLADSAACADLTQGFDRFRVNIDANGNVKIHEDDSWAINAVKINRHLSSEKNSNSEDK